MAFVGGSGAGKSTLVDLILGLQVPGRGAIRAGGIDIHDNLPGWQSGLAVVPQEVVLLDSSLRSNTTFDLPIDEELLSLVVERAQLSDLVAALPSGMDAHPWESEGVVSPGVNGSGSVWPGRCTAVHAYSCSTKPPRHWTTRLSAA